LPPKLNPFVCDEDSDAESDDCDESDDESSSSDDESSSDESYVPGSSDSSDSMDTDGSAMEVDPQVLPDEEELGILTARNTRAWCNKWLSTVASQTVVMTRWRDDLQKYHLCSDEPEVSYILASIQMYF
jgi:hypothetical protein